MSAVMTDPVWDKPLATQAEAHARTPSPAAEALSAMERAVPEYRKKVSGGIGGATRGAHRVDGFRDGWQAAMAYVRSLAEKP